MRKFDFTPLRAEVKKQLVLQNIRNYQELADMAGYKENTVAAFMSGDRNSSKTAIAIKEALKIKKNFGFEPKE